MEEFPARALSSAPDPAGLEGTNGTYLHPHTEHIIATHSWHLSCYPSDAHTPQAAAATVTPIAVIADNEEHLVPLPNTVHDATLNRSIISKRKAFATNGRIKAVQPCTFTTTSGECFASSTTITLRWRYGAGLQSYQETFYLVEGCASYDAILRKDIEKLEDGEGGVGKAFPMQFGRPGKKGQDDKRSKEQVKGERDRQCEGEMEMQKAQLRKQMEGMKMPQQKVR